MKTKKTKKKKKMPKSTGKELVEKKDKKKKLIWQGASSLMGVDIKKLSPTEIMAQKARNLVAKALQIPPNTGVLMGNQPYVDNHGRKWKMKDYSPKAQFEYDYVQIAKDDAEKAIVKARIIDEHGKALCGWVLGECSPSTIRMSTLKGYQNHLAQTRAENRAFEAAFGTRFRSDLYEGIAKAQNESLNVEAEVIEKALGAGNTSAEEAIEMRSKANGADITTYDRALRAISVATNIDQLMGQKERVKGSKLYNEEQKGQLLRMIDARINFITENPGATPR